MEEKDIITALRNSFYLGNYYKAIETFKEHASFPYTKYENVAKSLFIRSLIKLGKNFPKAIENFNVSSITKELELAFRFLSPLNTELSTEEATKLYNEFKTTVKDTSSSLIAQEINKLLLIAKKDYASFLSEEKSQLDIESLALQFYSYIGLKRVDLCEKTLKAMQTIDEEDVLSNLCNIHYMIITRTYESALSLIDEIRSKYEDSTKLANLKALCLISLGRFEEASVLLYKLYNIMTSDEKFYDSYELEITLQNLIVLSKHPDVIKKLQVDNREEFIKTLKTINPTSQFLKKMEGVL